MLKCVIVFMRCYAWLRKGVLHCVELAKEGLAKNYISVILILTFLTLLLVQDVRHTSSKLELIKHNNNLTESLIEYGHLTEALTKVNDALKEKLSEAVEAIEEQNALIQDLVDYLKKIGHWPPKAPRPTPKDPVTQV